MARKAFGIVFAGMMVATAAHAEGFADSLVAQLRAEGFTEIETERTLLGRTKIVASGSEGKREIVINQNGEIMRDLWLIRDGGSASGESGLVSSRGSDDDDDEDDNGGNSGSGGNSSGGSGGDDGGSGGGNGGDSD
jgi:hypothetical protein